MFVSRFPPRSGGGLDVDPWLTEAVAAAQALGATEWSYLEPPLSALTSTSLTDNDVEGGAVKVTNSQVWVPGQPIFQNMKTSNNWYLKVRFKQSALATAGQHCYFSCGAQSNNGWQLRNNFTSYADVWTLAVYDGTLVTQTTGITVDTDWHTLEAWHTTGFLHVAIDGVDTTIADTHLGTSQSGYYVFNSAGPIAYTRKVFWAWSAAGI